MPSEEVQLFSAREVCGDPTGCEEALIGIVLGTEPAPMSVESGVNSGGLESEGQTAKSLLILGAETLLAC